MATGLCVPVSENCDEATGAGEGGECPAGQAWCGGRCREDCSPCQDSQQQSSIGYSVCQVSILTFA